MKSLAELKRVLRGASLMAKALGDAYAWSFYRSDRELLGRHLKHPRQDFFPSGMGGKAELGFAQNVTALDGRMVLHHSVTSILRHGDFSLIKLTASGATVDAIGEMKALSVKGDIVSSHLSILGREGRSFEFGTDHSDLGDTLSLDTLSPARRQRLKRQLKQIRAAMQNDTETHHHHMPVENTNRYREMALVLEAARPGRPSIGRIGEGLVVVAVDGSRRSLYRRLAGPHDDGGVARLPIVETVTEVMLPGSSQNMILSGTLLYDEADAPRHLPGTVPPIWWDLPNNILSKIYLRRLLVMTLYNPAHLLEKLEREGFEIRPGEFPGNFSAEKERGGIRVQLQQLWYYVELAKRYTFDEKALLSIITNAVSELEREGPIPGKTDLRFEHRLGPPPWEQM